MEQKYLAGVVNWIDAHRPGVVKTFLLNRVNESRCDLSSVADAGGVRVEGLYSDSARSEPLAQQLPG